MCIYHQQRGHCYKLAHSLKWPISTLRQYKAAWGSMFMSYNHAHWGRLYPHCYYKCVASWGHPVSMIIYFKALVPIIVVRRFGIRQPSFHLDMLRLMFHIMRGLRRQIASFRFHLEAFCKCVPRMFWWPQTLVGNRESNNVLHMYPKKN